MAGSAHAPAQFSAKLEQGGGRSARKISAIVPASTAAATVGRFASVPSAAPIGIRGGDRANDKFGPGASACGPRGVAS